MPIADRTPSESRAAAECQFIAGGWSDAPSFNDAAYMNGLNSGHFADRLRAIMFQYLCECADKGVQPIIRECHAMALDSLPDCAESEIADLIENTEVSNRSTPSSRAEAVLLHYEIACDELMTDFLQDTVREEGFPPARVIRSSSPTDSLPVEVGPPWMTFTEVAKMAVYRNGLQPISTGYETLDDALGGGFRPESVYIIAGRTGSAKTTLALNMARRVALCGAAVLIFKLEEPVVECVKRIHAAASQVQLRTLLDGPSKANGDERAKLIDGWKLIRELPIRMSDARPLTAIERISREHAIQDGKLIIVDQLSMVQVEDASIGFERATIVSNALRRLAIDLEVPILIVSQVNRTAAKTANAKDHLSCHDLRDSGEIENDAAGVILIDRVREPESQWRSAELIRTLDIIIAKNRYGPVTDPESPTNLTWYPACCRIEESRAAG